MGSLCLRPEDELVLVTHKTSLSAAYALGEKKAKSDLMVFVHQDVAVVPFFDQLVLDAVQKAECQDTRVGLIGAYGVAYQWRSDVLECMEAVGSGWDHGGHWPNCKIAQQPMQVDCVDAVLMIKRKGPPYFDPAIPTFHGAAEDLCMAMRAAGRSLYVGKLDIAHFCEDKPRPQLERDLHRCVAALVAKWKTDIPSVTRIWEHSLAILTNRPVADITKGLHAAQS
jgi:hypothetical protein